MILPGIRKKRVFSILQYKQQPFASALRKRFLSRAEYLFVVAGYMYCHGVLFLEFPNFSEEL